MKKIVLLFVLLVTTQIANAELKLRHPSGDHMVLQQNADAAIWGFAKAGSTITVTPSWDGKAYKVKTGTDGEWTAFVSTPSASYTTYTIDVAGDGGHIVINNVLIGEVWLASGQSNMEIPLRGFTNCPIENYNEVITRPAARDRIRMFYAHADQTEEMLREVRKTDGWQCADPNSIPEMSAVGYFFAKKLNDVLDIPIGIVAFPRGGARVESWLPKSLLETYGTEDLSYEAVMNTNEWTRAYQMYNAMEVPLQGYTAKGFIWYQGCSNVGKHDEFVSRMADLVKLWRSDWGDTDASMPFYMVEIAPYLYDAANGESGALLRKAQLDASKVIPNCSIVSTNDLVLPYEATNIHPAKKEPIGNRLAYLALNRDYGHQRVACYSPEAVSASIATFGESIPVVRIELANCPNGIDRTEEIEGLEVRGKDGQWKTVSSVIIVDNKNMMIRTDGIDEPSAVRYGWADFRPGNLHSCEGLPVFPFNLEIK